MKYARILATTLSLLATAQAFAGATIPVLIESADDGYNFASASVGTPVDQTITLTVNANGTTTEGALLGTLALQGTSAANYSIVGGTCSAGSTFLVPGGTSSCTVVVRYTPTSAAAAPAQLAIACTTGGIAGGFSVTCNNTAGQISLLGSVLAAIVSSSPAPLLDTRLLTLLSVMLVAIGGYFATRRSV